MVLPSIFIQSYKFTIELWNSSFQSPPFKTETNNSRKYPNQKNSQNLPLMISTDFTRSRSETLKPNLDFNPWENQSYKLPHFLSNFFDLGIFRVYLSQFWKVKGENLSFQIRRRNCNIEQNLKVKSSLVVP